MQVYKQSTSSVSL